MKADVRRVVLVLGRVGLHHQLHGVVADLELELGQAEDFVVGVVAVAAVVDGGEQQGEVVDLPNDLAFGGNGIANAEIPAGFSLF